MQGEASASYEKAAEAHAILLNDPSFQFDRAHFDPPQTPGWLRWIGEALQFLAPVLKWVFWIGLALLAGLILYAIVREILRLQKPDAKPDKPATPVEADWRPDVQAARDLLVEADALAARGQYADAAHLLLLQSVQDIEKHQPRALRASLTAREIARLKALPEAARPAFERIGRVVERSLFGGAAVGAQDFADCRQAYEAFALPEGWRA
ncbi:MULTISPECIES: DUF4129 domain-containing protein [Brevundimonas]|uniref:DUF4129 domain-containing protein n=1 Tax=Brevundimonas TaxID=41275 RepID=UPI000E66AC25|nr:DUF4129 domain-containing protein [Brevundimonas sp. LPMIX5]RIJ64575.1 DUF4129 domain-containing protein [Brevundimonas sp. LPMIX5]